MKISNINVMSRSRRRRRKGSGAFPGKMLTVRIIENNKIIAYFRSG